MESDSQKHPWFVVTPNSLAFGEPCTFCHRSIMSGAHVVAMRCLACGCGDPAERWSHWQCWARKAFAQANERVGGIE